MKEVKDILKVRNKQHFHLKINFQKLDIIQNRRVESEYLISINFEYILQKFYEIISAMLRENFLFETPSVKIEHNGVEIEKNLYYYGINRVSANNKVNVLYKLIHSIGDLIVVYFRLFNTKGLHYHAIECARENDKRQIRFSFYYEIMRLMNLVVDRDKKGINIHKINNKLYEFSPEYKVIEEKIKDFSKINLRHYSKEKGTGHIFPMLVLVSYFKILKLELENVLNYNNIDYIFLEHKVENYNTII